jgi:hypothetical protein
MTLATDEFIRRFLFARPAGRVPPHPPCLLPGERLSHHKAGAKLPLLADPTPDPPTPEITAIPPNRPATHSMFARTVAGDAVARTAAAPSTATYAVLLQQFMRAWYARWQGRTIAAGLDTEVTADFGEGNFDGSAADKPAKDVERICIEISAQKSLWLEFTGDVADRHEAAGIVPDGPVRSAAAVPLRPYQPHSP